MLTAKQAEVLQLMKEGWELRHYRNWYGGVFLQKGELGKGGEVRRVNMTTFYSLTIKHLVEIEPRQDAFVFPRIYTLTNAGEEAVKGEDR